MLQAGYVFANSNPHILHLLGGKPVDVAVLDGVVDDHEVGVVVGALRPGLVPRHQVQVVAL
jgi:hypothetical protein